MNATPDTRIALDRYASNGEAVQARKIVRLALAAGLSVSVHDGEEWTVNKSTDHMAILAALATTESDTLRFRLNGKKVGVMLLVWGNAADGSELVADYGHDEEGPFMAVFGPAL